MAPKNTPTRVAGGTCPLYAKRAAEWRLLADNPPRLTKVATGPVVPLTSLLSLFEFDVGSQVQPFQTAARTAHLDVGWVAVASSYGVVSDAAELGDEGAVGGTAQFGLPHERCLRHSPRSGQSSAPPLRGATASLRLGFQPAQQRRHHRTR